MEQITESHIKKLLLLYMKQNDLGFISIDASMSMDKKRLKMSISKEDADDTNDYFKWN